MFSSCFPLEPIPPITERAVSSWQGRFIEANLEMLVSSPFGLDSVEPEETHTGEHPCSMFSPSWLLDMNSGPYCCEVTVLPTVTSCRLSVSRQQNLWIVDFFLINNRSNSIELLCFRLFWVYCATSESCFLQIIYGITAFMVAIHSSVLGPIYLRPRQYTVPSIIVKSVIIICFLLLSSVAGFLWCRGWIFHSSTDV